MEYYIQGSEEKASQIKAAFERLGYTTSGFNFKSDKGVYYTDRFCKSVDFVSNFAFVELIKTHPDYQELELPVEPKFNVGDKIQAKDSKMYVYTVLSVDLQNQKYTVEHNFKHQILFTKQDNFELVPPKPHYDIASFKPFDHCRFKPTETHDWIYADFWYVQAHYKVEHLSAIEKWES